MGGGSARNRRKDKRAGIANVQILKQNEDTSDSNSWFHRIPKSPGAWWTLAAATVIALAITLKDEFKPPRPRISVTNATEILDPETRPFSANFSVKNDSEVEIDNVVVGCKPNAKLFETSGVISNLIMQAPSNSFEKILPNRAANADCSNVIKLADGLRFIKQDLELVVSFEFKGKKCQQNLLFQAKEDSKHLFHFVQNSGGEQIKCS